MGNKSNNQLNKKYIFDKLNKTINSFTSSDNCSFDDDKKNKNSKRKQKSKNLKAKYKLKKHKNIINNNEMNEKIIESSLSITDFLINNIIDKKYGKKPLPDADLINSVLIFPDLSVNEGFDFQNQKEFCDKLLYNGLNNFKNDYYEYESKKRQMKNRNIYNNPFFFNNNENPVSTEKIFVNDNYELNNENIRQLSYDFNGNKNNDCLYMQKRIITSRKNKGKKELDNSNKRRRYYSNVKKNNKKDEEYDDNPYIEKNKDIEKGVSHNIKINYIKSINNVPNINKGNYVKKKIYIFHKNGNILKSKEIKNNININKSNDKIKRNEIKVIDNIPKKEQKIIYIKKKIRTISNDGKNNRKNNSYNKIKNKSNKSKYSIDINNSYVTNIPQEENNKIKNYQNFNIKNKINNNFIFNDKNNIEFKNELKKLEFEDNKILNNLKILSLKDYLDKETKMIKNNRNNKKEE